MILALLKHVMGQTQLVSIWGKGGGGDGRWIVLGCCCSKCVLTLATITCELLVVVTFTHSVPKHTHNRV